MNRNSNEYPTCNECKGNELTIDVSAVWDGDRWAVNEGDYNDVEPAWCNTCEEQVEWEWSVKSK